MRLPIAVTVANLKTTNMHYKREVYIDGGEGEGGVGAKIVFGRPFLELSTWYYLEHERSGIGVGG